MSTRLITTVVHLNYHHYRVYLRENYDKYWSGLHEALLMKDGSIERHCTLDDVKNGRLQGLTYHRWEVNGDFLLTDQMVYELNARKIPHPIDVFEELGT